MTSALSPAAALAHALRLLEAEGFAEVARNARGDAIYLRPADCPWHLRLSNHARTAKQRARRSDILASLVIAEPRAPDQVADAVRAALRNFSAARTQRAAQPSVGSSRK